MTVAAAVLVALLSVGSIVSLLLRDGGLPERVTAAATVLALAALGLLAVVAGPVTGSATALARSVLIALFFVATLGGGPVTATMLWVVDRGGDRHDAMQAAGEVLRGGAWIGRFERAAIFAAIASGWPEGLAVVLALKGLGRYSELRGAAPTPEVVPEGAVATPAVAERFLIGTFASVLWACACAGTYLTLRA
jgi:hypothetical protein